MCKGWLSVAAAVVVAGALAGCTSTDGADGAAKNGALDVDGETSLGRRV